MKSARFVEFFATVSSGRPSSAPIQNKANCASPICFDLTFNLRQNFSIQIQLPSQSLPSAEGASSYLGDFQSPFTDQFRRWS
ncbi:MAG: hypothetical protein RMK94_13470 [Armatimonadota bacterium]|nr:hypothetical protein [Armatimonadota bacterium]